jgi:NADP-dependent aldehyde dehydrogenase
VAGQWRESQTSSFFQAENPSTGELLPMSYPVSSREEVMEALRAGEEAAEELRGAEPETVAKFLEACAAGIEERAAELVEMAHAETALPKTPRLKDAELPRTVDQLRQAARAARDGSWQRPVRDEAAKIYSVYAPLGGPVVVMGPNNFPFAFNSAAGGDFAAAIAARNPVIAKANTGHPGTTRLLAEIAFEAGRNGGLPASIIQLIYRTPRETGLELAAHPLTGATAFTADLLGNVEHQSGGHVGRRLARAGRGHRGRVLHLLHGWHRTILHQSGPDDFAGGRMGRTLH